jgi:hypothetical protein
MNPKCFCILLLIVFLCFSKLFAQVGSDASATGISRAFNPAISVNCLFDAMQTSRSEPLWDELGLKTGFHYQEICMEMTSNVDVYLQSKVVFSAEEENGLAVEEAYLTTLRMPLPVILRGGKMFNTFGKHNLYHLHHMAFAEVPMILDQIFGPALNEVGIEASYLVPASWYCDAIIGVLNGDNPYLFGSDKKFHFAYLSQIDNLWDLSDETTLRVGGSFLYGQKGLQYPDGSRIPFNITGINSRVWGIDFHLKWKPLERGRYRSFTIQGEYLNSSLSINGKSTRPMQGFFLQILNKVRLRWWIQARYGWFNRPPELHDFFPEPVNFSFDKSTKLSGNRLSLSLAYVPTEFGAYRLQYNLLKLGTITEHQIIVQVNVTIGSHPAHKY